MGQGVGHEVGGERHGTRTDRDRRDPERVVKLEPIGRRRARPRPEPGVQVGAEQGGGVEGRLAGQESVRRRELGFGRFTATSAPRPGRSVPTPCWLGFRPSRVGSARGPKSSACQTKPWCAIGTVWEPAGVFTSRCERASIRPNSCADAAVAEALVVEVAGLSDVGMLGADRAAATVNAP